MRRAAWLAGCLLLSGSALPGRAEQSATAETVRAGDRLRLRLTVAGRELPSPANPTLARHESPLWVTPLLAWLEGDTRESLAVRAARWDGTVWTGIETVSPQGPGSQLALAGTMTADGGPILVWSGFDGVDDEILWSRRGSAGWSKPARLASDNSFPDILPAIAGQGDGAIAAWSRYDGNDYRVVVSRLVNGTWTEAATLGPKGSYHAALGPAAKGRTALAFQSAAGWQVIELDRRGRPTGRKADVAAPADPDDRAAIESAGARSVTLRWRNTGIATTVAWR